MCCLLKGDKANVKSPLAVSFLITAGKDGTVIEKKLRFKHWSTRANEVDPSNADLGLSVYQAIHVTK